jgi:hypothetical protein
MLGQSYTISSTAWRIEQQADKTHLVINNKTGEQHTALSYRSAYFLQNMFNDQDYWYNYERNGTTITWNSNSTLVYNSTVVGNFPTANWRYCFGDSKDTYFQFYLEKGPNTFQRWMYRKILGIRWEKVN